MNGLLSHPIQLTFRALNPSRSAFMAFYLDERFFDSYSLEDGIERKYQVKLKVKQFKILLMHSSHAKLCLDNSTQWKLARSD